MIGAVSVQSIIDWFSASAHWHGTNGIPHRLEEHISISIVSLLVAAVVALPAGVVLGHLRRGGLLAQNLANIGRAVPSLAILIIAVPFVGIGARPAELALIALAVPPMLTNAYVGMAGVDDDVRDAARGMGMTGWDAVWRAELPLALPLILAGARTAAFQIIATATLAAIVASGGLGQFITEGIEVRDNVELVCGSLLVIGLAVAVEILFAGLQRLVVPDMVRNHIRSVPDDQLEATINATA
ncbi:MAG: ABC transporter permease [Acidimicrobiales bacterium]